MNLNEMKKLYDLMDKFVFEYLPFEFKTLYDRDDALQIMRVIQIKIREKEVRCEE